jgi:hypothetical protein
MVESRPKPLMSHMGGKRTLAHNQPSSSKPRVQLRQALLQHGDILRARRLELAQVFLVDMRDFAGLDAAEQLHQPVALLVPGQAAAPPCFACEPNMTSRNRRIDKERPVS